MKTFHLNFSLAKDDDRVIQLMDDIQEFENGIIVETDQGDLYPIMEEPIATIYVDCTGGENRIASMYYHFLSTRPFDYQYVVSGDLSSNAINLLLALNPRHLIINRQACSTIHLSSYNHPVKLLAFTDEKHSSLNDYRDFKGYLQELVDVYRIFLTKEELSIVKSGGDISLGAQRLLEVFQKLKKSKPFQQRCKNIFELTL